MSLNIITTPSYDIKLPASGKKVKYRPFLVKEEKALLIAMQEDNDDIIINAINDIVKACTYDSINAFSLPSVDVEYLFLMIRNKSMGEGLNVDATCVECRHVTTVECNLEDVKVSKVVTDLDKKIQLSNNLTVIMRLPSMLDDKYLATTSEVDQDIHKIARCIEFIQYNNTLYDANEVEFTEFVDFVENLTSSQMAKLKNFIDDAPSLKYEGKFACDKCKKENTFTLKGLNDFFD